MNGHRRVLIWVDANSSNVTQIRNKVRLGDSDYLVCRARSGHFEGIIPGRVSCRLAETYFGLRALRLGKGKSCAK